MPKTSAAKCNILVLIDQPKELATIRYAVQKCGYQLWETATVDLALQLAHDHQPNLALLDVGPSLGEQDNLSLLIEHLHQQQIPTILITPKTPGQELKKYITYTTLDYIQRPIDVIGLVWRIKSALWHKGIQTELEFLKQRLRKKDHKLEQLRQRAVFDDSIGVFNYPYLLNLVKLEFARGVRHNTPLAFLLLDIPCIRQINEAHGYKASEDLLREVAQLTKNTLRSTDTIGRCKENRLGILLPKTDLTSAKLVAEKICQLVKSHSFSLPTSAQILGPQKASIPDKSSLKLDTYIGLSAYPDKRVSNYGELLEVAHKSLSLAKEQDPGPACLCNDCPSSQVVGLRSTP